LRTLNNELTAINSVRNNEHQHTFVSKTDIDEDKEEKKKLIFKNMRLLNFGVVYNFIDLPAANGMHPASRKYFEISWHRCSIDAECMPFADGLA